MGGWVVGRFGVWEGRGEGGERERRTGGGGGGVCVVVGRRRGRRGGRGDGTAHVCVYCTRSSTDHPEQIRHSSRVSS